MSERRKPTNRRLLKGADTEQPAASPQGAIANDFNALRAFNGVRFTHELEKMQEASEHSPALYMLLLRIRTGYMDVSIPIAGPLIESQAAYHQAVRSNQMGDAIAEWACYLAAREAQQSQDQPDEKA